MIFEKAEGYLHLIFRLSHPNKARKRLFLKLTILPVEYGTHIINLCQKEVGKWSEEKYPNTTRVTKELLNFWFVNPERHATKQLFFTQREAVETAVWINEVAEKSNAGQHILNKLRDGQQTVSYDSENQLYAKIKPRKNGLSKTVGFRQ